MRETWIREIEAEYEAQRERNQAEHAQRLAQAAALDPQIGALAQRRTDRFARCMREALANPADALRISGELTAQVDAIQQDMRRRLVAVGLDEAFLQPRYACGICRDKGYVGEPVRERCACFERRLRERVAQQAGYGLNPLETFALYDETIYKDEPLTPGATDTQRSFMARMRARGEAWADSFPDTPTRNLVFFGTSGLGKTYLLNCIGNRVHAMGGEVAKLTAYQLTERIRAAIFQRDEEGFSALLAVPLLLLDDLGVEPLYNNMTVEYLFTLLNERTLAGRHTIVSTNLQLDELRVRYTERVCSRLFDQRNSSVWAFKGRDVRLW